MDKKRYPRIDEEPLVVSESIVALSETSKTVSGASLVDILAAVKVEDIPDAIKYLVDKLALVKKNTTRTTTHSHKWDNYQLSNQVISMAPKNRKPIYGDYDNQLRIILEEKYK